MAFIGLFNQEYIVDRAQAKLKAMSLRPQKAHWFETYVPRNQTIHALEALAQSGLVELESDSRLALPLDMGKIGDAVAKFHRIQIDYGDLLPDVFPTPAALTLSPEEIADKALGYLQSWTRAIDRRLGRKLSLEAEQQNLQLLDECLTALRDTPYDLQRLTRRSRFLYTGLFACSHENRPDAEVCASLEAFYPGQTHDFFIVADLANQRQVIELACREQSCRRIDVPDWLSGNAVAQGTHITQRMQDMERSISALMSEIEQSKEEPMLVSALGDMALLSWFVEQAGEVSEDIRKLCHVTGWTTSTQVAELEDVLRQADIRSPVRFATAPDYCRVPVRLLLPAWARPFLFFLDMMGTPDSNEVDPGLLLPLTVSLLFGYMFPDVGHGLLLVLFSSLLYRRWPQGRFLIPCGLSAILFGFVFGEVFGLEGLLEPLWIKPMEHPLLILIPPMLLGAVLMLLGLIFNGIEAGWRGETRSWLLRDAAVLVMYGTALVGIFHPAAFWVTELALLWYLAGQLFLSQAAPVRTLLTSIALLLQSLFELLLNTLSFLRVGAFALAHAALSSAVLQIADGIANPVAQGLFLLLGHGLILVVEGMVVFVQTTRLILFEFFTHFLKAEGRLFKPLQNPQQETGGER
jgi:V/A-type H+-transporting ATPase subunit I